MADPIRTRTVCSYCGVGCGMVVESTGEVITKVSGDREHPTNRGRLCTKGATHAEMMLGDGRMATAYLGRGSERTAATVDEAVAVAASGLRAVVEEHGPDAVALYVSGQMSLEAQYLATKLAKGYLRTVHIESNSRLCMASAGTGYKLSLGADGPPGSYDDFDHADVFFVIGSNMADCHPILYLRMVDRLSVGAKLIVVDPRRTTTADRADLFLQIAPGTDLALLNGLLHLLVANGHIDAEFIAEHTEGWQAMEVFLAEYTPERVAAITGLAEADIRTAALWIGESANWMSCWTMGLNQSTHGVWNTNALCNLHLATGAICRPGSGPMSLTGQPNAMGGREMGYMGPGLPGQRAVVSAADRTFVETRWGLPEGTIRSDVGPGTIEMFGGLARGEIRAVWIICTNPVASVANRSNVIAGLEKAELVISQDTFTDTATNTYADVLLPATLWAESDSVMVNSERTLTLARGSVSPRGDARPDWRLICDVAAALGFGDAFDYTCAADIFDEIVGFSNKQTGYDLRGINHERLRRGPVQWPAPPGDGSDRHPIRYVNDGVSQHDHVDADGRRPALAFATPTRRAVFFARPHLDPAEMPDDEYPIVLNTGRLQHHWHTLTKTGKVAKLNRLHPGPFVEIHPDDADALGARDGAPVEIVSRRGRAVLPAVITNRVRAGACWAPFHWNDAQGEGLTINAVTHDAVDPLSLQPEFKVCAVSLRPVMVADDPAGSLAPEASSELPGLTFAVDTAMASALGVDTVTTPALTDTERLYVGGFLGALGAGVVGVPVLPGGAPVRPQVRAWVDGMLAGRFSRVPADVPVHVEQTPPRASVLLLWASQTGTAEDFAHIAVTTLAGSGLAVTAMEMDDCDLAVLASASEVLVVSSTFGAGGPPDNGADFWERLAADSAPKLDGLSYAVLGLGDSSYDEFCGHARRIDERLAALGAHRRIGLVRCEPDDDAPAHTWLSRAAAALSADCATPARAEPRQAAPTTTLNRLGAPAPLNRLHAPAPFTRARPGLAVLSHNEVLSGPSSAKEVRRFGLDTGGIEYQPGDALAVIARNDPRTVERWLDATGLPGDHVVTVGERDMSLREALTVHYDVSTVSPRLLEFVGTRNRNGELAKLLRRDNRTDLDRWMHGRQAPDLLMAFPVRADVVEWTSALAPLSPRQYSISSSPLVSPSVIDLTVSVVRYGESGGVCSTFLADRAADTKVSLFLTRSPHFRPPADASTPMIMVGPGTGIAPFRGFLQHRRALGHTGRTWLFFGDQHAAENFYYRTELEDMFRDGFLDRLDLAFSRDQRERIYVQDRMIEHGAHLWRWLEAGAHLYVCGDASRMARDVDEALLSIIAVHGKLDEDQARAYRKTLTSQKRYVRDVY